MSVRLFLDVYVCLCIYPSGKLHFDYLISTCSRTISWLELYKGDSKVNSIIYTIPLLHRIKSMAVFGPTLVLDETTQVPHLFEPSMQSGCQHRAQATGWSRLSLCSNATWGQDAVSANEIHASANFWQIFHYVYVVFTVYPQTVTKKDKIVAAVKAFWCCQILSEYWKPLCSDLVSDKPLNTLMCFVNWDCWIRFHVSLVQSGSTMQLFALL